MSLKIDQQGLNQFTVNANNNLTGIEANLNNTGGKTALDGANNIVKFLGEKDARLAEMQTNLKPQLEDAKSKVISLTATRDENIRKIGENKNAEEKEKTTTPSGTTTTTTTPQPSGPASGKSTSTLQEENRQLNAAIEFNTSKKTKLEPLLVRIQSTRDKIALATWVINDKKIKLDEFVGTSFLGYWWVTTLTNSASQSLTQLYAQLKDATASEQQRMLAAWNAKDMTNMLDGKTWDGVTMEQIGDYLRSVAAAAAPVIPVVPDEEPANTSAKTDTNKDGKVDEYDYPSLLGDGSYTWSTMKRVGNNAWDTGDSFGQIFQGGARFIWTGAVAPAKNILGGILTNDWSEVGRGVLQLQNIPQGFYEMGGGVVKTVWYGARTAVDVVEVPVAAVGDLARGVGHAATSAWEWAFGD